MTSIALDSIERIEIGQNDHFNEIGTLRMLSVGLRKIYMMIKQRELAFEHRLGGIKMRVFVFGSPDGESQNSLDTTACFFHWFGGSVCNYARLVGFIRGLVKGDFSRADLGDESKIDTIKSSIGGYVTSVNEMANVKTWRDKVFAHFAITDPRKDDNIATLDMSVIFPVTFEGRYFVGSLAMMRGNAITSVTSQLPRWSLTEVFESLVPRFWPGFPIPTIEQYRAAFEAQSGEGANI